MNKIKKFDKFSINESVENIVLTMDDVRALKNNLGGRDNDPVKNYGWSEDQTIVIAPTKWDKPKDWNGKKVQICELFTTSENPKYGYGSHLGYGVLIDDKPEYLVSIYEPHGYEFIRKKKFTNCSRT